MNSIWPYLTLSLSLLWLWVFPEFSQVLLQAEWFRLFYLVTIPSSLILLWHVWILGEALRQFLQKLGAMPAFSSGINWAASLVLGVGVLGNLAILMVLGFVHQPWIYQVVWVALILLACGWVNPWSLGKPLQRLWRIYSAQAWGKLGLGLVGLCFSVRYFTTVLPINGTEQLHNTLPFAKMLFRGIDFNHYTLDNHFLLLGTYETFGVFLRAFTRYDFAYHIVAQELTYLLTIGGMTCALGTLPWLLRRWPWFSLCLLAWPTMLNFAVTDTVAFKPDWLGVLAAGLATLALVRQWRSPKRRLQEEGMIACVIFSGLATITKLTALPYVVFLLPLTVLRLVFQQKRLGIKPLLMPLLYLLIGGIFFGKNIYWLGNPFFPGLQNLLPKPERLAETTTFNTFQINKVTQKIPDWRDYFYGYARFWKHHPEFLLAFWWWGWLVFKRRPVLLAKGLGWLFLAYLSLIVLYFYPDIYQRYVAFAYILLLFGSVALWREFAKLAPPAWIKWSIFAFGGLMLTHSALDSNLRKSWPWWGEGVSPQAYRVRQDPVDQLYFTLNERCQNVGRLLNQHWRNYLYANFDTVNLEDLRGWFFTEEFYQKYHVNFVITSATGPKAEEMKLYSKNQPWFAQNFMLVQQVEDVLLWQRRDFSQCHPPFSKQPSFLD